VTGGKDFWHDVRVGVTKDLTVRAITYTLSLPVVLALVAAAVRPVGDWLLGDSHMLRFGVVLLVWLLLIAIAGLARFAYMRNHERTSSTAATPKEQPRAPLIFAPETFERTPPGCRALLVLRHRVDARTTLGDLHQLIADTDGCVDRQTTKAQLQHDMEAAERAGLVSIDRALSLTHYYNLTIPEGRDWVLSKQHELQVEAGKGMTRKEQQPRYS
jgi:hypothetical protein